MVNFCKRVTLLTFIKAYNNHFATHVPINAIYLTIDNNYHGFSLFLSYEAFTKRI